MTEEEMNSILGQGSGDADKLCDPGADSVDCTSELASGGGTTDTE